MRIYNGTNSQLTLPLNGNERITIAANSVSGNILPSTEFLSLLVSSFDYNEIAIVVSGPFEINMCAGVSGAVGFVVQSIEEAIEKFANKDGIKDTNPKAGTEIACSCADDGSEGLCCNDPELSNKSGKCRKNNK